MDKPAQKNWIHPLEMVKEQAEDEALWFVAETGSEAYVQKELRKLHKSVEDYFNSILEEKLGLEYCLKDLIHDLEKMAPDLVVKIDTGTYPLISRTMYKRLKDKEVDGKYYQYRETLSCFDSWRGNYNLLSLKYSKSCRGLKVKDILYMALFINEKVLCGYKMGEFKMDLHTAIYIDNYSDHSGPKLVGAVEENGFCILKTTGVREGKNESNT